MKILIMFDQSNTEALLSAAYLSHWYDNSFKKGSVGQMVAAAWNGSAQREQLVRMDASRMFSRIYLLGISNPLDCIRHNEDPATPIVVVDTAPRRMNNEYQELSQYANVVYHTTSRGADLPPRSMGEIVTQLHASLYTSSLELPQSAQHARTSEAIVKYYRNQADDGFRYTSITRELVESQEFYRSRQHHHAVEFLNKCVAGSIVDALSLV